LIVFQVAQQKQLVASFTNAPAQLQKEPLLVGTLHGVVLNNLSLLA
jgi:hypothetical protein